MSNNKPDGTVYPKPKVVILFAVGMVLLLFSVVFVFTRNSIVPGFAISESKGEIGDAINGITAPITSLIGAGLVFYSFLAQLEANKLIQAQWQYDSFTKAFNDIQIEISNLKYTVDENGIYFSEDNPEIAVRGIGMESNPILYQGSEAIIEFTRNFEKYLGHRSIAMLNDLSFILEELIGLINEIENSQLSESRKTSLFYRMNRLYVAKLQTYQVEMEGKYIKHKDKVNKNDDSAQPYYQSVFKRMTEAAQIMRKGFSPTNVSATLTVNE